MKLLTLISCITAILWELTFSLWAVPEKAAHAEKKKTRSWAVGKEGVISYFYRLWAMSFSAENYS